MFVVYAKGKNHSSAFLHPVQEEKLQNMKKKTLEDLKNTFLSNGLYKK
jgi:hypothetical protein|tara:strand:- start:55 stop:198 length:144 start_codon:yes stop_codon:yes gene_type:complete